MAGVAEWHYAQGGTQAGPVTFAALKAIVDAGTLKPDDLVWKAGMPSWVAASTIHALFSPPNPTPPPLPSGGNVMTTPTSTTSTGIGLSAQVLGGEASYTVVMEPYTGRAISTDPDKVDVAIDGRKLGSGSLRNGFRLFCGIRAFVGVHNLTISPSVGVGAKLLGMFGKRQESSLPTETYRIEFPEAGDYTVQFRFEEPRSELDYPVEATVVKQGSVQGIDVLAKQGAALVGKGFSAVARGLKNWDESARRYRLTGLWEPVSFSSQWFMFTEDNALLRGDGLGMKFRWLDDNKIELYADETDKTVQFTVLSLGEFELMLKVGDQTGHFKKGTTITEELRHQREEEYRKRQAEAAENFKKVATGAGNLALGAASVLAAGGFAVLCCGVAVGAASAAGRCHCRWPIPRGSYCVNCGYLL